MNEKVIWLLIFVSGVVLGIGIGNYATRRLLQLNQESVRFEAPTAGFCTMDGRVWWKARSNGCWAIDEPR
jgi:hypothetical protein